MMESNSWSGLGTTIASLMFLWTMVRQCLPYQFDQTIVIYARKLFAYVYPYIEITFHEYTGERFDRSEAYTTIQAYLSATTSARAKKLKGNFGKDSGKLFVSLDDDEQVTDDFEGTKVWWSSNKTSPRTQVISIYPAQEERRFYRITFHRRHREIIMDRYLDHVVKEGKAISVQNRQRKLFTNNPSNHWHRYNKSIWSHVVFEHPATFRTLAMDPGRKRDIIEDLEAFTKAKDYYNHIGKAWKRGYLLYGPPGTGKSTMIAAMANLLDYDIYDLELTAIKDNTELRKLLIETTSKSIIVIEDIDCSLDLSGKRKKEKKPKEEDKDGILSKPEKEEESKVTLSGLLNFIDGLWSSCGGERIIVFTTNYFEKLDPALIRRGRMDKHIELSYCCFEAFKVLAKNYLNIDSHPLFEEIKQLMEVTKITPADVAENLIRKFNDPVKDAEYCLPELIQTLKNVKEEMKAKEEASELERKSQEEKTELKQNGVIKTTAIEIEENGSVSM